jgi:hypothetical protein
MMFCLFTGHTALDKHPETSIHYFIGVERPHSHSRQLLESWHSCAAALLQQHVQQQHCVAQKQQITWAAR